MSSITHDKRWKRKPVQGLVNHNFENFLSIPEIKDK